VQYETADEEFNLYVMLAQDADDGERQEAGQRDEVPENQTVLGVYLNATTAFAVTSSGAHIGSADQLAHERQQYERRRGRLQQTGTRSAHLTIQSLGGRFARWSTERLHCWANELLIEAERVDADGIILEVLTHIRERIGNGEQFQRWAFAAFIEIVEYKAGAQGLFAAAVDLAYTTQRCSKCGHTHEYNRDGSRFSCRDCGYTLNADYNAAKNVGLRYCRRIQRGQTFRAGWATCQLALKSGTLNVNGEYTPSSSGEAERESTDKSSKQSGP
jgi:putative transposase